MKINQRLLDELKTSADPCDVIQEYFDDLGDASDLPLESFCQMGGYPDEDEDPSFQVLNAKISEGLCSGRATTFFTEKVYGGGCPDMPTLKARQGDISFTIDLNNGEIEFKAI